MPLKGILLSVMMGFFYAVNFPRHRYKGFVLILFSFRENQCTWTHFSPISFVRPTKSNQLN